MRSGRFIQRREPVRLEQDKVAVRLRHHQSGDLLLSGDMKGETITASAVVCSETSGRQRFRRDAPRNLDRYQLWFVEQE